MNKNKMKNMFLTDKIARKALCVGGLSHLILYNDIYSPIMREIWDIKNNSENKFSCWILRRHFF